jgi:flagellar hook protein FlgE
MQPAATTGFSMTQNLNSQSAVGSQTTGQVQVYDSLGNNYEATVTYTNQGNNTWGYSVALPDALQGNSTAAAGVTTFNYSFGANAGTLATVDPGTNLTITGPTASGSATITAPTVTAGETVANYVTALNTAVTAAGITGTTITSNAAGQLKITGTGLSTAGNVIQDPVASAAANGTLTFDSSGNLVSPATNVSGITFAGLSDGAASMNLNFDLFGANGTGNISQTAAASSTSATSQNGFATGQYESFAINSSGLISATYSNGQTQNVGQLALATVSNEQGLVDMGSTEYQATTASGNATVGAAGVGGRGTIEGSSLEASNVNISAEFSDLIVAQRAFEANSKAVTTFDSVTEETINMIH